MPPHLHPPFHPTAYSHHPPFYPAIASHPTHPSGHPLSLPAQPMITSPNVSPGKALRLKVSLEKFCEHYGLIDSDVTKLSTIGYRPGMPGVEQLSPTEWADKAGFSALEWMSFLVHHKQFLRDAHDGKWKVE